MTAQTARKSLDTASLLTQLVQQLPARPDIDKQMFFCLFADGTHKIVVADSEDEITGADLVMSLHEITRIKRMLDAAKLELLCANDVVCQ